MIAEIQDPVLLNLGPYSSVSLIRFNALYLEHVHGKVGAKAIMDDIDRRYISSIYPFVINGLFLIMSCRIAAAPSFPGLRRFPDGRGFAQWTGNDSKALMKVDT